MRLRSLISHHGALLLVATLALGDLAYRRLLRGPVRRALGMSA